MANLKVAAAGEMFENTKMYPSFASVAESEVFLKSPRLSERYPASRKYMRIGTEL